ncbi:GNAT family N-acetyltransferase [Candidatus Eisenbacteria bacterium]|uniref:GNAT family N-acetyltransferase n=1 Tax=Eiseniibacteriota bacterium TaxID=2212470 RepID=A0ABV6YMN9_UNCEI
MEIEVSIHRPPDIDQVTRLFRQAGWLDKIDDERVMSMIENSTIIVTAWDKEVMVGFARCMTDYAFNGQINNVVVDEKYRGRGIGKRLIGKILSSSEQVTYVLRADPDNIGFYKKLGFEDSDLAVVYRRKT